MKKCFTLLYCFFLTVTQSQELKTIEILSPESKKINDLSFLKEELKDKQVVMLGEQTHMYGNIFEMKARVVEYLHQELGFTTIAMESSMYDIWKMNLNKFNSTDFNNAIWGVWSNTIEFQRVVNYIENNKIKVIGFDSQIKNASQFVEDFYNYCESKNITLKLDEDDFGIIIENVLENATIEEDDISYSLYEKEVKRIIKKIETLAPNETTFYWSQFTKSLLACSQDAYYNKEEILTTDFGTKNDNIRDKQMADNLLSYMHRNPNEKVIYWADNIHIMNDNSSINKPIAKEFISMGSYIKKELKNKAYSLATIHANDSLYDSGTKKWYKTPIKINSFESELNSLNKPYLFVTSNQEGMQAIKKTRLLNFIDFTNARLDKIHDGYIFFKNATLPKNEIEEAVNTQKKVDTPKKIEQIKIGNNVILKGQILDKETNEPIPFVTIILKKEEIYRVADENGFYELPVKKTMLNTASVSFSSIGYKTSLVLLKELNKKTFLEQKYDALNEVIVTSILSPKTVLDKAIKNKQQNHPIKPFNFYRYGKILVNKNDSNLLDLEIITKDYDDGYTSPFVITQRVEQIKWNINKTPKKYKYCSQFFHYRQNAIRYANILHKRKYKKFKLNFEKSKNPEDEGLYIIAFKTERDKWNYTNRVYPTAYSGKVYINKETYAIVKVIENWETALKEDEIKTHFKDYKIYETYKNAKQVITKEENICYYSDVLKNGKYYATKFFNRRYSEILNTENKKTISVFERDSNLFDFEINDIEEIEYEHKYKEQTKLNRVEYDKSFWDSFYKENNN